MSKPMFSTDKTKNNLSETIFKSQEFSLKGLKLEIQQIKKKF